MCGALGLILVSLAHGGGKEEQTESVHVPQMTGTRVSHNFGIPTSKDNFVSCVQVGGNGNMSSALSVWEP